MDKKSSEKKPDEETILELKDVSVKYDSKTALEAATFDVRKGEIFALVGGNGAGKSTILSCICRKNHNYGGSVKLLGKEVKDNREMVIANVALVPQENIFFSDFTVYENLKFACTLFNITGKEAEERISSLLSEYRMEKFRNTKARKLSGGYKRLLTIAVSVVKKPMLVLMDEPSAALDVEMRELINNVIYNFKKKGMSVIITTHYLEDVEHICDRAAFFGAGNMLIYGTISDLIHQKGGPYVILISGISGNRSGLDHLIGKFSTFEKVVNLKDTIYLVAPQKRISECLDELSLIFRVRDVQIDNVAIHEPSLNRVFLGLMRSLK